MGLPSRHPLQGFMLYAEYGVLRMNPCNVGEDVAVS